MTTLSLSESRRELFAVDAAVLGLSRPAELSDSCVLLLFTADGSGDLDCTEAVSCIDGST